MIPSATMTANAKATVFDQEHRNLTIGLLLILTLVAFENLSVVTIAPIIASDLDGLLLYGWIFSGQLLASLFSIVIAGQWADRFGPARPFLVGMVIFAAGLFLAGIAPNMSSLITGRVLQGLGGGAITVAVYVAVNLAYHDSIRSRMIALMSTAWVVPGLVGPVAAGVIAESLGWRIVFLGMLPLLAIVMLLTFSSFQKLNRTGNSDKSQGLIALILVIGTAVFLAGLNTNTIWLSVIMVLAGLLSAFPSLKTLLPEGTLRLQAGLPSVIATRGFFYAAFLGVEAFLALMLTSVHGFSSSVTGFAIATAAISWTAGSWVQDQWDKRNADQRQLRIVLGACLMTLGLSIQLLALYATALPLVITLLGWLLAGLGIGVAHGSTSVLAFALAPEGEEGQVSAGLQLADTFIAAFATGVGGALFAFASKQGFSDQTGIMLALVFSLSLALMSIISAIRISRPSPQQALIGHD